MARTLGPLVAVAALALFTACSASPTDPPAQSSAGPNDPPPIAAPPAPGSTTSVDLDGRPYRLHVPPQHDPAVAVPLVVGLHGYTSNASEHDSYFGLTAASDARGFLLALPEGTTDAAGDQFWNAVDGGCCDFYGADVDDSAYLSRLVEQVAATFDVGEVVLVGHSNGGYMAHRFACEHADQVTALASLAGPLPRDTSRCAPSRPVRVLHIHGDADDTVPYAGGGSAASAEATAQTWAELNGCSVPGDSAPAIDVEAVLPGAETSVARFADGCQDSSEVELWTIQGGGHVPAFTDVYTPALLDFVLG